MTELVFIDFREIKILHLCLLIFLFRPYIRRQLIIAVLDIKPLFSKIIIPKSSLLTVRNLDKSIFCTVHKIEVCAYMF